jgi:undecaprenyl diphosphate synthase
MLFVRKRQNSKDYRRNTDLPQHIAVIPDGNGRWAAKRGMPRNVGHKAGSEKIKDMARYCAKLGIKYLTVYVFSTENWKRPKDEVDMLMRLFAEFLDNADTELEGSDIRIRVLGNRKGIEKSIAERIGIVEKATESNSGLCLCLAVNYGGRDEILNSVKIIADRVKCGDLEQAGINETEFENSLYTSGIPAPDLLIRTGGEKRISNFLLWQSAYSELWFSEVLWPDFSNKHIDEAISDYMSRHRRFGGV